ncbi:MAG: GntR family transcriptional regulator [Clostridiales bacterium]|nr:GntR family transcriptional regulator [Clostridiales bacterium]
MELKPGESILDMELAKELEVSRTPVREALLFLKEANFIDIYPQSGTFVSLIDINLIREVIYLRHIIECELLLNLPDEKTNIAGRVERYIVLQELAVKEGNHKEYVKNDHLFHRELFDIAGHRRSWDLMQSQYIHTIRFHMLDFYHSNTVFATSLQEHKEIVACIESRDKKSLKELLDIHHDCELRTADILKAEYPTYFL